MRINDMASANTQQNQATNPNFVYKTRNSDGLTGMEITGMTETDYKTVKVSGDIKEKLVNLAKDVFLENYGMNDGERMNTVMKKYIASAPEKDRINVAWTLGKIWNDEYGRIENLVSENIPNWKVGKPFDRDFVSDLISRGNIDKKV